MRFAASTSRRTSWNGWSCAAACSRDSRSIRPCFDFDINSVLCRKRVKVRGAITRRHKLRSALCIKLHGFVCSGGDCVGAQPWIWSSWRFLDCNILAVFCQAIGCLISDSNVPSWCLWRMHLVGGEGLGGTIGLQVPTTVGDARRVCYAAPQFSGQLQALG